jgi:hypothetical protein
MPRRFAFTRPSCQRRRAPCRKPNRLMRWNAVARLVSVRATHGLLRSMQHGGTRGSAGQLGGAVDLPA